MRLYAQIHFGLQECGRICFRRKAVYGDADRGRACKEAALAMLADIYLTLAPNHRDYYE